MPKKIAVLIGSLRRESLNRKMAHALIKLAPDSVALEIIELGALTLYNQDLDDTPPAAWTEFRDRVRPCDGLLFITPEYNRSVPAVLKNALDIGSRPYGKSVWDGKPGAVMSLSPGAMGAFGANHHLRQSLVFLNVPVMQQPEAYIGGADKIFGPGPDGELASERRLRVLPQVHGGFRGLGVAGSSGTVMWARTRNTNWYLARCGYARFAHHVKLQTDLVRNVTCSRSGGISKFTNWY